MADLQVAAQQMFEATGSTAVKALIEKHGIPEQEALQAIMMGGAAYVASLWFAVADVSDEEGALGAAREALDKAIEAFWVQMVVSLMNVD